MENKTGTSHIERLKVTHALKDKLFVTVKRLAKHNPIAAPHLWNDFGTS